jgi:hypothetical protein
VAQAQWVAVRSPYWGTASHTPLLPNAKNEPVFSVLEQFCIQRHLF